MKKYFPVAYSNYYLNMWRQLKSNLISKNCYFLDSNNRNRQQIFFYNDLKKHSI